MQTPAATTGRVVSRAGAGIRGGLVHGASDNMAAYPTRDAVSPEEVAAAIIRALGISADTELAYASTIQSSFSLEKSRPSRPLRPLPHEIPASHSGRDQHQAALRELTTDSTSP